MVWQIAPPICPAMPGSASSSAMETSNENTSSDHSVSSRCRRPRPARSMRRKSATAHRRRTGLTTSRTTSTACSCGACNTASRSASGCRRNALGRPKRPASGCPWLCQRRRKCRQSQVRQLPGRSGMQQLLAVPRCSGRAGSLPAVPGQERCGQSLVQRLRQESLSTGSSPPLASQNRLAIFGGPLREALSASWQGKRLGCSRCGGLGVLGTLQSNHPGSSRRA